jgi:tetratricopeptide (TPR) repeat protein
MPFRECHFGRHRSCAARLRTSERRWGYFVALATLFCATVGIPGCRMFRSRQVSEENVAAARQLSLQGLDAQQRGQWERAEMLFAAAILKCPSDERARSGYAEALWQRGDYASAIGNMEDAVRLSGNDPERLVRLGSMYLHQEEVRRALALAQRAIDNNSQLAGAWALRGQALLTAGDLHESLASFHRAISIDPNVPDVQLAIADIYSRQNRPQRALATLQTLAERFPAKQVPAGVRYREGLALRALGRPHDAIRVLAEAAERGPASADLLFALAEAQVAVGERTAARQAVHLALTINPAHPGCAHLIARLDESPLMTASAEGTASQSR